MQTKGHKHAHFSSRHYSGHQGNLYNNITKINQNLHSLTFKKQKTKNSVISPCLQESNFS